MQSIDNNVSNIIRLKFRKQAYIYSKSDKGENQLFPRLSLPSPERRSTLPQTIVGCGLFVTLPQLPKLEFVSLCTVLHDVLLYPSILGRPLLAASIRSVGLQVAVWWHVSSLHGAEVMGGTGWVYMQVFYLFSSLLERVRRCPPYYPWVATRGGLLTVSHGLRE